MKINLQGLMYLNMKFRIIKGIEEMTEYHCSMGQRGFLMSVLEITSCIQKTCWVKLHQIYGLLFKNRKHRNRSHWDKLSAKFKTEGK